MKDKFPLIILSNECYICALLHPTPHGQNLAVTSASWDWSRPITTASKVCTDSTGNELVKTSVCCINFGGCYANVTLLSSRNNLVLWIAFGWSGSSAFWQRLAVLLHGRFWHRLDILIFFKNKIIVRHWNKRQRMRGWSCGSQISCKPGKIFVKCSHLKWPALLCPQNFSALFVGRASTFVICFPTTLLLWFP